VTTTATVSDLPEVTEPTPAGGWRGRLERLGALFFRPAPEGDRLTWRAVVVALIATAAGTWASLLRQPRVPAWDSIWAEDGHYTLGGAVDKSFLGALITPVEGYYQTLPRLLVEPVSWLPAEWAAKAIALEAAGVTAVFAVFVYVASGAHLRTPLARFAAAAVAIVPPVGMNDVPNALCNIHWPGIYATFWALLYVPRGRLGQLAAVLVAFSVGVTNIIVIVMAPLAIARFFFGPKDWRARLAPVALFVGLIPQIVGRFNGAAATRDIPTKPDPLGALGYFFGNAVPRSFFGEVIGAQSNFNNPTGHWLLPTLAWGVVVAAVVVAAFYTSPNVAVAALLGAHAFVFWAIAAGSTGLMAARYEATMTMLLIAGMAALLLPYADGRHAAPLVVFAIVLTSMWSVNYRVENNRQDGPRWSTNIAKAKTQCAVPGTERVRIRIAPLKEPWFVDLPCSYVGK
jgi:hypothetical protein